MLRTSIAEFLEKTLDAPGGPQHKKILKKKLNFFYLAQNLSDYEFFFCSEQLGNYGL